MDWFVTSIFSSANGADPNPGNRLYRNDGGNDFTFDQVRYFESQGDGTFIEVAQEAGLIDTGQGRGLACFDTDRDGDIDLVLTNNQEVKSIAFYRNELLGDYH